MDEPYYFGEYLDVPPITENIGKVARILKLKPTPFEVGLKETYRWYTRNHKTADRELRVRRQGARDGQERHQERLHGERVITFPCSHEQGCFEVILGSHTGRGADIPVRCNRDLSRGSSLSLKFPQVKAPAPRRPS